MKKHDLLLRKEKQNVGWKKYLIFNYINVKKCFKCWGYYHIAKNCTRNETCHKCAGNHKKRWNVQKQGKDVLIVKDVFKNKIYNLKINDEHDTFNKECPTLKRVYMKRRRELAGRMLNSNHGRKRS